MYGLVPPVIFKLNIPSDEFDELGLDNTTQSTPIGNNVNTLQLFDNLKTWVGCGVGVGVLVDAGVFVGVGVCVGVVLVVGVVVNVGVGDGLGHITLVAMFSLFTPFDGFE